MTKIWVQNKSQPPLDAWFTGKNINQISPNFIVSCGELAHCTSCTSTGCLSHKMYPFWTRKRVNRCHFNSSSIMFYCYRIHCSIPHARTAHSLLQQQASRPTPNFSCHQLETHSIVQEVTASHWVGAASTVDCVVHRCTACCTNRHWSHCHSLACCSNWRCYTASRQHSKLNECSAAAVFDPNQTTYRSILRRNVNSMVLWIRIPRPGVKFCGPQKITGLINMYWEYLICVLMQVDLDVGVRQFVSRLLSYVLSTSTFQPVSYWKMLWSPRHQNCLTGRRFSRIWMLESLWKMWARDVLKSFVVSLSL